jgi:hypothetical protein
MTDFEDRLATALRQAGDDAPDAAGLAPAARGRARARSRRTALATVAAVVAVAGVVGGVALVGGGDGGPSRVPAADDPTPTVETSGSSPATRLESWRDLSVQVPTSYGYGNLSTYCIQGAEPVVERPGGVVRTVGCGPYEQGYGVAFRDGALADLVYPSGHIWQYGWESDEQVKVYPEDSWLGFVRSPGDNLVWVVAEDRATVEEILGSVVSNDEPDPLGCATHQGGDQGDRQLPDEGLLRVCRYAIDGWLEESEILSGEEAADAVAALDDAPAKGERMCTAMVEGPTIVLSASDAEGQVTLDACQGFSWAGKDHDLTADVLYWALSPGWSGGVEGDVPLPERLRQQ